MTTHINRLKCAISNAPGVSGALTIAAAASGFRTFGAAHDGMTVDCLLLDGTAWEVRTGCVYTHATTSLTRGTLEDSSTGAAIDLTSATQVLVTASAEWGNALENEMNRGYVLVHNSVGVSQSIAVTTSTKISTPLDVVAEDTFGWWDVANKRFKPTRAGIYLCKCSVAIDSPTDAMMVQPSLRKNVSEFRAFGSAINTSHSATNVTTEIDSVIYMNGSTDYLEVFLYHTGAAAKSTSSDVVQRVLFSAVYFGQKSS